LKAANNVNTLALQEQGLEGKALGQEIKNQRVKSIKEISINYGK